jgi:hypothetical protein
MSMIVSCCCVAFHSSLDGLTKMNCVWPANVEMDEDQYDDGYCHCAEEDWWPLPSTEEPVKMSHHQRAASWQARLARLAGTTLPPPPQVLPRHDEEASKPPMSQRRHDSGRRVTHYEHEQKQHENDDDREVDDNLDAEFERSQILDDLDHDNNTTLHYHDGEHKHENIPLDMQFSARFGAATSLSSSSMTRPNRRSNAPHPPPSSSSVFLHGANDRRLVELTASLDRLQQSLLTKHQQRGLVSPPTIPSNNRPASAPPASSLGNNLRPAPVTNITITRPVNHHGNPIEPPTPSLPPTQPPHEQQLPLPVASQSSSSSSAEVSSSSSPSRRFIARPSFTPAPVRPSPTTTVDMQILTGMIAFHNPGSGYLYLMRSNVINDNIVGDVQLSVNDDDDDSDIAVAINVGQQPSHHHHYDDAPIGDAEHNNIRTHNAANVMHHGVTASTIATAPPLSSLPTQSSSSTDTTTISPKMITTSTSSAITSSTSSSLSIPIAIPNVDVQQDYDTEPESATSPPATLPIPPPLTAKVVTPSSPSSCEDQKKQTNDDAQHNDDTRTKDGKTNNSNSNSNSMTTTGNVAANDGQRMDGSPTRQSRLPPYHVDDHFPTSPTRSPTKMTTSSSTTLPITMTSLSPSSTNDALISAERKQRRPNTNSFTWQQHDAISTASSPIATAASSSSSVSPPIRVTSPVPSSSPTSVMAARPPISPNNTARDRRVIDDIDNILPSSSSSMPIGSNKANPPTTHVNVNGEHMRRALVGVSHWDPSFRLRDSETKRLQRVARIMQSHHTADDD